MNSRLCLCIISTSLVISCSAPPIEVTRNFSNQENFSLRTGNAEVEFVKDTIEYVKYFGNANSDPITMFKLEEKLYTIDLNPVTFLEVIGYVNLNQVDLHKVEIHYIHLRRMGFVNYQPPTSLGVIIKAPIYTREPIQEDSIDIILRDEQDSVIDVNTNMLDITGYGLFKVKVAGTAHYFTIHNDVGGGSSQPLRFDFGGLETDSSYLNFWTQFGSYHQYVRIDVKASNYLDIQLASLISTPANCPTCLCEVYYKGYPTIINHDSLDSRVVIINNN